MSFFEILDEDILQLLAFSKTVETLEAHSRRNRPLYRKLKELTPFLSDKSRAKQRLWHIENKTTDNPKCNACKIKEVSWVMINNCYNRFCSIKCASNHESVREKTKQTNTEKYGVGWNIASYSSRQKKDNTCMEKYGTTNPAELDEIKNKRRDTMLETHSVEHNWATGPLRDAQKQTMVELYGVEHPIQHEEIKEKIKQTNAERYGIEWNIASESSKQKRDDTCLERYGVLNPFQNEDIKDKIKQTNFERYGVEHPLQHEEIKEKIKQTNTERYGVEWNIVSDSSKQKKDNVCMEKYGTLNPNQRHMLDVLPRISSKNWMMEQYIVQEKTATQIANELEIDGTTILNYLHNHNIEIRQSGQYSYECILWLNSIMKLKNVHIQHANNGGEFKIPGTKYKADGYCAETNTIYEFHGDYWHGNPKIYESEFYNKSCYTTMGELYQKTIERENIIKSLGYNLVVIWESDYQI